MSVEITFDAKIAAGFNQAGSLVLITSLTGTDGAAFLEPLTVPLVNRGARRFTGAGRVQRVGFEVVQWQSYVSLGQYATLQTTYERDVTVRTTKGAVTYANYNAYLQLSDPVEMTYLPSADATLPSAAYLLTWTFSIVGAI